MNFSTRRDFLLTASALATLAGCGGGGDTGALPGTGVQNPTPVNTNPTASLSMATPKMVAFTGDVKTVGTVAKDARGVAVTNPTITWSSSAPAVATVDAQGRVTAVAPGAATITATANGQTATLPIEIAPPPASVGELRAAFPFERTEPGAPWSVASDVTQPWSDAQGARLKAILARMASFYPVRPAPLDFLFTTDRAVLTRHAGRLAGLGAAGIAAISNVVQVADPDGNGRIATFFFVDPADDSSALTTMLHESGEFALDASLQRSPALPDATPFGWLREGLGLYWESGTIDAAGAFAWSRPTTRIVRAFRANHATSAASSDVTTLKTKTYDQVVGTDPAARTTAYAASGMLASFLQVRYPAQLKALVAEAATGAPWPLTPDGLMARLLALLSVANPPIATEQGLTAAYVDWSLQQPFQ